MIKKAIIGLALITLAISNVKAEIGMTLEEAHAQWGKPDQILHYHLADYLTEYYPRKDGLEIIQTYCQGISVGVIYYIIKNQVKDVTAVIEMLNNTNLPRVVWDHTENEWIISQDGNLAYKTEDKGDEVVRIYDFRPLMVALIKSGFQAP